VSFPNLPMILNGFSQVVVAAFHPENFVLVQQADENIFILSAMRPKIQG
jgi:hypothetical protein